MEISYNEDDSNHIIAVIDNGRGIRQEHFSQIFELFTTLGQTDRFDSKGTGIGLSTVKKLLDKLNGRIEVESEYGVGSTFRIYLKK